MLAFGVYRRAHRPISTSRAADRPREIARTVDLPARYEVVGVRIAALTFDEAIGLFLDAPGKKRWAVHFCTTHTLVESNDRAWLRAGLNRDGAIAAPDGMPLVWVGRMSGRRVERICGPDAMLALMDQGRAAGRRHFLYGGAPGVPEELAARLQARLTGLKIVGTWSPPFRPLTPDEDAAEVARINDARPDYVWVGLGTPKQDRWVIEHRDRIDAALLLAVGAAFDFHSGNLRRAPRWMQRTGTEWLFRLLAEPRRLAKRYAVANTRFALLLARQFLSGRRPRIA
jgi:N-acetylglucosaminyldiphosphoundecaprenol N-acetyl-beta-D-mannosaminyltransferase